MEEAIKKSWESSFKNILDSIDKGRTVEEVAAMFFELGWKAGVENMNSSICAATIVLRETGYRMNKHHKLTLQLLDLLTKEEIEKGEVCITYDCGIATDIKVGSSMVDKLIEESPWRDHIIGFKRNGPFIDIVLDEEGQSKWNAKENEIQAWCNKYGCD